MAMDLPKHYFPTLMCPHIGESKKRRFLFAEYGSYQNVNVEVDEEGQRVSFWPQKGQSSIKNLRKTLPSLPLFDHPIQQDEWTEWDHVLGMENSGKMLHDLNHVTTMLLKNRGLIRTKPQSNLAKKFNTCKGIVKRLHPGTGNMELTPMQTEQDDDDYAELRMNLDTTWLKNLAKKYINITSVSNNMCLSGYNRDFYGGLLCAVTNQDMSTETLIHAGEKDFKKIYVTNVSQDPVSRLKTPEVISSLSVDAPVFQIVASSKWEDEASFIARQKNSCLLVSCDTAERTMSQKDSMRICDEIVTAVSFSPYLSNEVLVSGNSGSVYLWDINTSYRKLLEKPPRFECPDRWSCSYFSGHPRQVVVADNTSVEMFDHRSHFKAGVELFSLSAKLIKPEERVMMATSLGYPYHAVVTDFASFVMDQRFTSTPVLQWSPEFKAAPQYIQVLQDSGLLHQEKLLCLASQQPAQVMCFPVNISQGRNPTSSILPWKVSEIGEFCQSSHTSYICDLDKVDKRFETSLAGMAVSRMVNNDCSGFTVYQLDGYGDIFYQTMKWSNSKGERKVKESTEDERKAADERASTWLKSFDSLTKHQNLRTSSSSEFGSQVLLDSSLWQDIFHYPAAVSPRKGTSDAPVYSTRRRHPLHRRLTPVDRLPSAKSNTQLHLALKANADITEILQKREADHTAKRKKMREETLKRREKIARDRKKYVRVMTSSSSDTDCDDEDQSRNRTCRKTLTRRSAGNRSKSPLNTRTLRSAKGATSSFVTGDSGVSVDADDSIDRAGEENNHEASRHQTGEIRDVPPAPQSRKTKDSSTSSQKRKTKNLSDSSARREDEHSDTLNDSMLKDLDELSVSRTSKLLPDEDRNSQGSEENSVAKEGSAVSSEKSLSSERQLSSFTRSQASGSSATHADSVLSMPFSITQNTVRRSLRHIKLKAMDKTSIDTDTDQVHEKTSEKSISMDKDSSLLSLSLSSRASDSSERMSQSLDVSDAEMPVKQQKISLLSFGTSNETSRIVDVPNIETPVKKPSAAQDVSPLSSDSSSETPHIIDIPCTETTAEQDVSSSSSKATDTILRPAKMPCTEMPVIPLERPVLMPVSASPDSNYSTSSLSESDSHTKCLKDLQNVKRKPRVQNKRKLLETGINSNSVASPGKRRKADKPKLKDGDTRSSVALRVREKTPGKKAKKASHLQKGSSSDENSTRGNERGDKGDGNSQKLLEYSTEKSTTCTSIAMQVPTSSKGLGVLTLKPKGTSKDIPNVTDSPSLFSSSGASATDAAPASEALHAQSHHPEIPASSVSPHRNVLSWLLQTLPHSSHHGIEPSTSTWHNPNLPRPHQAFRTNTSNDSRAMRKLEFEKNKTVSVNASSPAHVRRSRISSDSSESDDQGMESDILSLPSSLRNMTLCSPQMRRMVDPSLSGFLSSPLTHKFKKKLHPKHKRTKKC